jgi:DNA helicase MCM9
VCKLKTECAVLAACNPKGHYDSDQPITVNIALPTPLLSRFDLVLLLLDSPNEEWDRLACAYLLQGKDLLSRYFFYLNVKLMIKFKIKFKKGGKTSTEKSKWPFEKLKLYLNYAKSLKPNLTPDANAVLQK